MHETMEKTTQQPRLYTNGHLNGQAGGAEGTVRMLLEKVGVQINGPRPADPQIHDRRFYKRVLAKGSLGLGEAYTDGWWDCEALDELFFRILRARLNSSVRLPLRALWYGLTSRLWNLQRKARAFDIAEKHYDRGNDLFECMLDRRMVYSCGYWRNAQTLDDAQEAKLDLICRKLKLEEGMHLLDIGCGWGSLVNYAVRNYGVRADGITISGEQAQWARRRASDLPINIRLMDYRDLDGQYDRIASVGMFEHVGYKNYNTFMNVAHRCLKEDGLFLLHTIGDDISSTHTDPWIHKHIFPNGMVPSTTQITDAAERLFMLEDWHNFGTDYALTLKAWYRNFSEAWDELTEAYDERFYRMWRYYLLSCAGGFRARYNHLYQIVWSRAEDAVSYESVR